MDGNDPFPLPDGTPNLGFAALANLGLTNGTTTHASNATANSKDILGVGLGLGLGLGLVSASLLLWAVRERRQRVRQHQKFAGTERDSEQVKDRTSARRTYRDPHGYGGPGELLQRGWEPAVQELRGSSPPMPEIDGIEMRQLDR